MFRLDFSILCAAFEGVNRLIFKMDCSPYPFLQHVQRGVLFLFYICDSDCLDLAGVSHLRLGRQEPLSQFLHIERFGIEIGLEFLSYASIFQCPSLLSNEKEGHTDGVTKGLLPHFETSDFRL